jgi:hypothetical protein
LGARTKGRTTPANAHYRQREYLTEREVEGLIKAAGNNRHGHRDATMVLLAFRHGLRASELSALRWEQVDLVHGLLHVARVKNGMPSVHRYCIANSRHCQLPALPISIHCNSTASIANSIQFPASGARNMGEVRDHTSLYFHLYFVYLAYRDGRWSIFPLFPLFGPS